MAKSDSDKENGKLQDSTSRIPMVDLETALKTVIEIRNKALETAAMPAVATSLGYANATSTPFYRRIAAARLFNLLSQKSSLTQEAVDYIRPHDESTKSTVLNNAIRGIPVYTDLVARYAGKKLNVELVANSIAKDCKLTDTCALVCAKAFEASLAFAGMLSADGTVSSLQKPTKGVESPSNNALKDESQNVLKVEKKDELPPQGDTQEHSIFLDRDKSRRFRFTGPLEITRAEYERICKWLEFTMLITEKES